MILLKNFHILNPSTYRFKYFSGDMLIKDGKISQVVNHSQDDRIDESPDMEIIDGGFSKLIFPGFIQTHIHLCQTSHRNLAEDLPLIDWLQKEIWPYEASLDRNKMGKTVIMALKEIINSGTTAVLDMGTVWEQEIIFEIIDHIGFRYTGGKAMMDKVDEAPVRLRETTSNSIEKSTQLIERFHGKNDGLMNYAFCPRFLLSCSDDLLKEVRQLSDKERIIIHTHGSEHPEEVEFIKQRTGFGNISYLEKIGALNDLSVIAHMIHLDDSERKVVYDHGLSVVHCPSSNLKLGSGVAPIVDYLKKGVQVGLGVDGAPCNNALSIFFEMKLASLLQKGTNHNPILMTAEDTLRLVSLNGSKISFENCPSR